MFVLKQNVFGCARVITKHYGLRGIYQGNMCVRWCCGAMVRCVSCAVCRVVSCVFVFPDLTRIVPPMVIVTRARRHAPPQHAGVFVLFWLQRARATSARAARPVHSRTRTPLPPPETFRAPPAWPSLTPIGSNRQEGWKYLAAGGTGGLLYWLLTYPTDVIKVRVRAFVVCVSCVSCACRVCRVCRVCACTRWSYG
jgi:hypothetical protein